MEKIQKRQVAHKVRVNDILKGEYVKEEGEWVPNYVRVGDKKVSRVNLVAVVVSKDDSEGSNQSLMIDDGSGRISIRSFEGNQFSGAVVGDVVVVVGRPREYGGEKYIVSEILKKVEDTGWVEVRKKELGAVKVNREPVAVTEDNVEEIKATEEEEEALNNNTYFTYWDNKKDLSENYIE